MCTSVTIKSFVSIWFCASSPLSKCSLVAASSRAFMYVRMIWLHLCTFAAAVTYIIKLKMWKQMAQIVHQLWKTRPWRVGSFKVVVVVTEGCKIVYDDTSQYLPKTVLYFSKRTVLKVLCYQKVYAEKHGRNVRVHKLIGDNHGEWRPY